MRVPEAEHISLAASLTFIAFWTIPICASYTLCLLTVTAALALLIRVVVVPRPALVTIPYSHYCELARWALDARGVDFVEIKFPVGVHLSFVALLRVMFMIPRGAADDSAESFPGSDVEHPGWSLAGARMLRRLCAVPCYIDGSGHLQHSSWAILAQHGFAVDPEHRRVLDHEIGPDVRRIMHQHIFQAGPGVFRGIQGCAALEMALFDVLENAFSVSSTIRTWLGVDGDSVRAASARVRARIDDASSVLEADPFLGSGNGGESFGGADLAFCALVAPLVLPPQYAMGAFTHVLTSEAMPAEYQALQDELRATRAGKHVLQCYERLRAARMSASE